MRHWFWIATLCVLLCLVVGAAIPAPAQESGDAATQPAETGPTITPEQAGDHLDKQVTVEGTVVSTRRIHKACFLNFSHDKSGFYVVIFDPALSSYSEPPETTFKGCKIRVSGKVTQHKGRPQIVVSQTAQISTAQ